MENTLKVLLHALVGLAFSFDALAYGYVDAIVTQVRIDQDGRGMVVFEQQLGGTPATCVHPAYTNALSFDANTAGGKAIMAMALAAKASATRITAYGNATCSIYGGANVEDWMYGVNY